MIISLNRRKLGLVAGLIAVIMLLVIVHYVAVGHKHRAAFNAYVHSADYVLVIDAGHGGADGGATSVTGITESIINLEIAQKLELMAAFYGMPTVMTRTSEDIDYPENADSIRAKKVYDTHNRVEVINDIDNAVVISIHQNIYESSGVSGPQVIYASTSGSEALAGTVQETFTSALNPSKTRSPVNVPSNVYIMNHISCPAVLVECGFLSNYSDDELLQSENYQTKIAASLLSAYIGWEDEFETEGDTYE